MIPAGGSVGWSPWLTFQRRWSVRSWAFFPPCPRSFFSCPALGPAVGQNLQHRNSKRRWPKIGERSWAMGCKARGKGSTNRRVTEKQSIDLITHQHPGSGGRLWGRGFRSHNTTVSVLLFLVIQPLSVCTSVSSRARHRMALSSAVDYWTFRIPGMESTWHLVGPQNTLLSSLHHNREVFWDYFL